MVSPASIPEKNNRCASLMIFILMMIVTVNRLLSLVSPVTSSVAGILSLYSGLNRAEREGSSGRVLVNEGRLRFVIGLAEFFRSWPRRL